MPMNFEHDCLHCQQLSHNNPDRVQKLDQPHNRSKHNELLRELQLLRLRGGAEEYAQQHGECVQSINTEEMFDAAELFVCPCVHNRKWLVQDPVRCCALPQRGVLLLLLRQHSLSAVRWEWKMQQMLSWTKPRNRRVRRVHGEHVQHGGPCLRDH